MKLKEGEGVVAYLKKRGLIETYKKAKLDFQKVDFRIIADKKRKPYAAGVFQFRIT